MEKITSILDRKQSHFGYISPNSSANEALCRMSCEGIDHLAVMDEDGNYLGVITEHDIATKVLVEKMSINNTSVNRLANRQLPIATTEDSVDECLQRMRQYNVKLLPVFEGFVFKGIVSSDDILQEAAQKLQRVLRNEKSKVLH